MVLFINAEYVKINFPLLEYVKENDIKPWIRSAQETYLKGFLGDAIYRRISVGGSTDDLNDDEKELLNTYIKPTLLWWTIYLYGRFCNFKFTNLGINKQNSDFSTSADLSEVQYTASGYKDIAESYSNTLIKFIENNKDKFNYEKIKGDKEVAKTAYNFGGLYIPKTYINVIKTK